MNELEEKILEELKVFKTSNSKQRFGGLIDGGYVIIGGYDYDCYISCGIGDNPSFDNHFVNNHICNKYYAFDGTCQRPSSMDPRIEFVNLNVGPSNGNGLTDMKSYFGNYNNCFLKMDIEGHEWEWLKHMGDLSMFKQIVLEAHGFFDETCPTGSWNLLANFKHEDILESLKILNKTHHLVHIHGNNAAVVKHSDGTFGNSEKDDDLFTVAELTFIRKDCDIIGYNTDYLPVYGLDFPNYNFIREIYLNKWPFVITNEKTSSLITSNN